MIRSGKWLSLAVLSVVFLSATVSAQKDALFTSDNKVDCVNKLVDWCDNMKYPKDGTGLSMVSISVSDSSGKLHRVFCASDSDSTNCTRNGSPWFSCNSNHSLIYNGVSLQKDKTNGVDEEVCNTTKMAFNDIFIQNLSYDPANITSTMTKGMEEFFREMAYLQEQLDFLRSHIFSDCFPFCTQNSNGLPYPSDDKDSATVLPDVNTSGQGNQLERE